MWERADSAFQKGRNSAINDMVDIATTYIIADTITSAMVDSLVDKDINILKYIHNILYNNL